jgi:hypothetical protein
MHNEETEAWLPGVSDYRSAVERAGFTELPREPRVDPGAPTRYSPVVTGVDRPAAVPGR